MADANRISLSSARRSWRWALGSSSSNDAREQERRGGLSRVGCVRELRARWSGCARRTWCLTCACVAVCVRVRVIDVQRVCRAVTARVACHVRRGGAASGRGRVRLAARSRARAAPRLTGLGRVTCFRTINAMVLAAFRFHVSG